MGIIKIKNIGKISSENKCNVYTVGYMGEHTQSDGFVKFKNIMGDETTVWLTYEESDGRYYEIDIEALEIIEYENVSVSWYGYCNNIFVFDVEGIMYCSPNYGNDTAYQYDCSLGHTFKLSNFGIPADTYVVKKLTGSFDVGVRLNNQEISIGDSIGYTDEVSVYSTAEFQSTHFDTYSMHIGLVLENKNSKETVVINVSGETIIK